MPAIPGVFLGPDYDDPDRNVCTFKKVCRSCTFCDAERRPVACVDMKCKDYTPCKKCKRNLPVNQIGLCMFCDAPPPPIQVIKTVSKATEQIDQESEVSLELDQLSANDQTEVTEQMRNRRYEITVPGKPPSQYSPSEKEYYQFQWDQYKDFYRDPTAWSILHNILLIEVELNWVNAFILDQRGKVIKELEVKQQRLITNLKLLRDQLPEKDANDLSDDEKSIAMIYQRYCEEIKVRRVGKISRLLTTEAQVLADHLHFKINPMNLCQRMGYQVVQIAEAVDKFIDPKDIPEDPEKFLEFMGFHLREKFAAPEGELIDSLDNGSMLGTVDTPDDFLVESPPGLLNSQNSEYRSSDPVTGPGSGESLTSDLDSDSEFQ